MLIAASQKAHIVIKNRHHCQVKLVNVEQSLLNGVATNKLIKGLKHSLQMPGTMIISALKISQPVILFLAEKTVFKYVISAEKRLVCFLLQNAFNIEHGRVHPQLHTIFNPREPAFPISS